MKNTFSLLICILSLSFITSYGLPIPPQDHGLPYTRSARNAALEVMKPYIVLHELGRYAYVYGYKTRMDNVDILRGEPPVVDGVLYVPEAFAGIVKVSPGTEPVAFPEYLADRWVHAFELPSIELGSEIRRIEHKGRSHVALVDVAEQAGLTYHNIDGMRFLGKEVAPVFEGTLRDAIVTQFDTPEKYIEPMLATKYIPQLKRQGVWTNLATVTAEDLALLEGPEPEWPLTPKTNYDSASLNADMFGTSVPAPGIYPRLLFSEADLPSIRERMKANVIAQKTFIELEVILQKTWLDPTTDDGVVFDKLASGDVEGLEWDAWQGGRKIPKFPALFEGYKAGMYHSHVQYNAQCLVSLAFYALLQGDDDLGRKVASATVNLYKLQEPNLDEYLRTSDSELGSTPADAGGSTTQWRGMAGVVPHMDLAFNLDFAGKWMTDEQKAVMQRVVAKATYGRRNNGGDGPRRNWRDINHMTWHMTHYLALATIEGLEGFDEEASTSGEELVQDFLEWGLDKHGTMHESNGKSGGGIMFQALCMNALQRRGQNYWGHPHWKQLMKSQVLNSSPNGQTAVSSGTWSGGLMATPLTMMFHTAYPEDRYAERLLSCDFGDSNTTMSLDGTDIKAFDLAAYRSQLETKLGRTRLPGPNTPAFTLSVLYDTDWTHTERGDLEEAPLDFVDEVQGILSSYSENDNDATWMHMQVRSHHYMGAGHHHADAGMFHFASGGINWITESAFKKNYEGRFHNQVLIDGIAEPDDIQGRADWLGASAGGKGAVASADLTQAYSYVWKTQFIYYDTDEWGPRPDQFEWTLCKDPLALNAMKGTQRYKMRPWWATGIFANWTPVIQREFNKMEYAYRSIALVRGEHSYGMVIDDLKKDDETHLYQFSAMPGPGVWAARPSKDLPRNMVLLAKDGDARFHAGANRIRSKTGDSQLLVCMLGGEGEPALFEDGPSKSSKFALNPYAAQAETDPEPVSVPVRIETMNDGPHWHGGDQVQFFYDRIAGGCYSKKVNFRTLLIPTRQGDPLPEISYDAEAEQATIAWGDQVDTLQFSIGEDRRTQVEVTRDGESVLSTR